MEVLSLTGLAHTSAKCSGCPTPQPAQCAGLGSIPPSYRYSISPRSRENLLVSPPSERFCHDTTPCFLPAGVAWTLLAVRHLVLCLAQGHDPRPSRLRRL